MLKYLKKNDPYRLIFVFLFLIVIQGFFILLHLPLSHGELKWMLLGEQVSSGSIMYYDIIDSTGIVPALLYGGIDFLFGRTREVYLIVGVLLVAFQGLIFNKMLIEVQALTENSFLPTFIYIILMSSVFDFSLLSPPLIGLTFILIFIYRMLSFANSKNHVDNEDVFYSGVYLGVAALCYLPYISFIFLFFFSIKSGININKLILFIVGVLFFFFFVWLIYFIYDLDHFFFKYFLHPLFHFEKSLTSFKTLAIAIGVSMLYLMLSLLNVLQHNYTRNQSRTHKLMFVYLFLALSTFFINSQLELYQITVFIPPIAYFISQYFIVMSRGFWPMVSFYSFLIGIFITIYLSVFSLPFLSKENIIKRNPVENTLWDNVVNSKKAFYWGGKIDVYKNSEICSPFLSEALAEEFFENTSTYDNTIFLYNFILEHKPDVIIDTTMQANVFFNKAPLLAEKYYWNKQKGFYSLK